MAAWDEPRGSNVSEGLLLTLVLAALVVAACVVGCVAVYLMLAPILNLPSS